MVNEILFIHGVFRKTLQRYDIFLPLSRSLALHCALYVALPPCGYTLVSMAWRLFRRLVVNETCSHRHPFLILCSNSSWSKSSLSLMKSYIFMPTSMSEMCMYAASRLVSRD